MVSRKISLFGKMQKGRSYSDLLSKFGEISFQEYVTEGISHPVFYAKSPSLARCKEGGHTLTCYLNLVKYRFKNMLRKESLTRSSTVI